MIEATQRVFVPTFLCITLLLTDFAAEGEGSTVDIPVAASANSRFSRGVSYRPVDILDGGGAFADGDRVAPRTYGAVLKPGLASEEDPKTYVLKTLLGSSNTTTRAWTVAVGEVTVEPEGKANPVSQTVAAQNAEPQGSRGKSPPLIRMLEGREDELALWLAVASGIFIVGWICGGNYYRRRDRIKRTRLRF